MRELVESPPDGYTLMLAANSLVANPLLYSPPPLDPARCRRGLRDSNDPERRFRLLDLFDRWQRRAEAAIAGLARGGYRPGEEAKVAVAAQIKLPEGYRLTWGGEFENQQRAAARLTIVIPVALGMIFMLLFATFGSGGKLPWC